MLTDKFNFKILPRWGGDLA